MGASVIRVGRRKRRSNCRPRPGCACDGPVDACLLPSLVTGQAIDILVEWQSAEPLFFLGGADGDGVQLDVLGGPFNCTGLIPGPTSAQFFFDDPIGPGPASLIITPGFDQVRSADGGALCDGSYPITIT